MGIQIRYFGTTEPRPGTRPVWQETLHKLPFGQKNPIDWTDGKHLVRLSQEEDQAPSNAQLDLGNHGDVLVCRKLYDDDGNVETWEWARSHTNWWGASAYYGRDIDPVIAAAIAAAMERLGGGPPKMPILYAVDSPQSPGGIRWEVFDLAPLLSSLLERIEALEDRVEDLEQQVEDLEARITALENAIHGGGYGVPGGNDEWDCLLWTGTTQRSWQPHSTVEKTVIYDVEYDPSTRNFTKTYQTVRVVMPTGSESTDIVFTAVEECP